MYIQEKILDLRRYEGLSLKISLLNLTNSNKTTVAAVDTVRRRIVDPLARDSRGSLSSQIL